MTLPTPETLLSKIIMKLDPMVLTRIHEEVKFDGYETYLLYKIAHEHEIFPLCALFIKDERVLKQFKFLGGIEETWIREGAFQKLDYPSFKTTGLSSLDVIEQLTGSQFNRDLLKKLGYLTINHGIRPLNNWRVLSQIYREKGVNVSEFLELDHSIKLDRINTYDSIYLEQVLARYNVKRCVHLLLEKSGKENFISIYSKFPRQERLRIIPRLPRRPKNWDELSKWLEKELSKIYPPDKELNQLISSWEGRQIGEYVLRVPRQVQDLITCSKVLVNCLDSYVNRVLEQTTLVLFLERSGQVELAVDIVPKKNTWIVRDILGRGNDARFQGQRGKFIRKELQQWCGELAPKKETS